jgi:nucleoside-diphosphate-sugar epimerase
MGQVKNILLTGSNGFLGSFILKKLLIDGYTPILLLRQESDTWRINELLDKCKIFRLISSTVDFKKIFELFNIEAIIHTATDYGRNGALSDVIETNILFPIHLIEEGRKNNLKLFINTDTFFAKKKYNQTYLKSYTDSKRILEQFIVAFNDNLKIVNMRIEHVYGENDSEEKFFTVIIKKLLTDEKEILLTDGIQKRDFIYANDVASAYTTILKSFYKLKQYQEFEVGTGRSIALKEFVQRLCLLTKSKSFLNFGALNARIGDISDSFAKNDDLVKLGWFVENDFDFNIKQIIKKEKKRFHL